MPLEIPLQAIPNQAFTINLNNIQYAFSIKFTGIVMTATIIRNGILLVTNVRMIPNSIILPLYPLIPYQYLENDQGNFYTITANDEYPIYTNFGVNQFLLYFSSDEIGAFLA